MRTLIRASIAMLGLLLFLTLFSVKIHADYQGPILIKTISPGYLIPVLGIDTALNRIYATTQGFGMSVIDGNNDSVIQSFYNPVSSPFNLSVDSIRHRVYEPGLGGGGSISQFDGITGYRQAASGANSPIGVAINPVTNKLYITSGGYTIRVLKPNETGNFSGFGDISSIDLAAYNFVGIVNIAVNSVTNRVYVSGGSGIAVIDGNNDSFITTIPNNTGLKALAVDEIYNRIYAAEGYGGTIRVIDGNTNQVVDTISNPNGGGTLSMTINPLWHRLYILSSGILYVVDENSNNYIASVSIGAGAVGDYGSSKVVTNPSTGKIYVVDDNYNQFIYVLQDTPSDSIAPATILTQSPQPNSNGWNNTDVNITLNATDNEGGSGVKEIRYIVNGGTENVISGDTATFTVSTEGTDTINYWSVDNVGNIEQTNTYSLKIDKTNPTIAINSPIDGATYTLNQPITANWTVFDNLSGIDSYNGTVASGQNIDTLTVGTHTFTVSATDKAGNTATETITYYVHYNFGGFQAPLGDNKVFNQNGVIPVKFQLTDYNGNIISSATVYLYVAKITDNIIGTDEEATSPGNADTGNQFRYDSTNNIYVYNLSASNAPLGSAGTYQLKAVLDDGSYYTSQISLK